MVNYYVGLLKDIESGYDGIPVKISKEVISPLVFDLYREHPDKILRIIYRFVQNHPKRGIAISLKCKDKNSAVFIGNEIKKLLSKRLLDKYKFKLLIVLCNEPCDNLKRFSEENILSRQ